MVELTALSSRKGIAIATFLNFYVSDANATSFFKNWREILCLFYRYFIAVSNSERIFNIG